MWKLVPLPLGRGSALAKMLILHQSTFVLNEGSWNTPTLLGPHVAVRLSVVASVGSHRSHTGSCIVGFYTVGAKGCVGCKALRLLGCLCPTIKGQRCDSTCRIAVLFCTALSGDRWPFGSLPFPFHLQDHHWHWLSFASLGTRGSGG